MDFPRTRYNIVSDWLSNIFYSIISGEILNRDVTSLSTKVNVINTDKIIDFLDILNIKNLINDHSTIHEYNNQITLPERELTPKEIEEIDELIIEFINERTSNIKCFATNLKIDKIIKDLESIKSFIDSSQEGFLENVLNNVDLSLCMKSPISSKNKTSEVNGLFDEEIPYSFEYND